MSEEIKQPLSEARKKANAKYDKENYQYISIKAKKGSRERIAQAAAVTNESVNGFMRAVLNKAVEAAIGYPMEDSIDKEAP